jgi:hypothetical protein
VGRAEPRPGVDATALPTQPFAVQQVRAGEFCPNAGVAKPLDRLAVEGLGGFALAQQCTRTRLDTQRPIGAGRARAFGQPAKCLGGDVALSAARGRLDELNRRPGRSDRFA